MSFDIDKQLLAILEGCDKDQLNKYLNDDESADILLKSLDEYQDLLKEKENLQSTNKKLAESNLKKEPILEELKKKLAESMKEFEDAKSEYTSLKEAYDAQSTVSGDMSLNGIYNSLQASASRAEEESDKSADDFFCALNVQHTEEELNSFQRQFIEARSQAHIKKIKADKIKELVPNY